LLQELRILPGPGPAGFGVGTSHNSHWGHLQGLAQRANGMLGFHRVNPLIALVGLRRGCLKFFLEYPAAGADSRSRAASW